MPVVTKVGVVLTNGHRVTEPQSPTSINPSPHGNYKPHSKLLVYFSPCVCYSGRPIFIFWVKHCQYENLEGSQLYSNFFRIWRAHNYTQIFSESGGLTIMPKLFFEVIYVNMQPTATPLIAVQWDIFCYCRHLTFPMACQTVCVPACMCYMCVSIPAFQFLSRHLLISITITYQVKMVGPA